MKPTPTQIEAACAAVILGEDQHGNPVHLQPSEAEAALSSALSVPAAAVVGEPVDDWTVDDTETAGEILTLLGIGCDASKEPGADWRRDKIAKLIRARISQQDAELERLRRELEEARAEHQFSLGLVDQAAAKLAEAREALESICTAIEREPIVGDLDYPHAHNDWRGWRKKVLKPAAEKARALLGGE